MARRLRKKVKKFMRGWSTSSGKYLYEFYFFPTIELYSRDGSEYLTLNLFNRYIGFARYID